MFLVLVIIISCTVVVRPTDRCMMLTPLSHVAVLFNTCVLVLFSVILASIWKAVTAIDAVGSMCFTCSHMLGRVLSKMN